LSNGDYRWAIELDHYNPLDNPSHFVTVSILENDRQSMALQSWSKTVEPSRWQPSR
jgi:hypothetical protein